MTNSHDAVLSHLDESLWSNSLLCQSVIELARSIDSFELIHGTEVLRATKEVGLSRDLRNGAFRDPNDAAERLHRIVTSHYPEAGLCRVFMLSDERVLGPAAFRCSDELWHECTAMPESPQQFREFLFHGIEHLDVLIIVPRDNPPCGFSKPLAAIVSAFDGEGFILIQRDNE